MPDDDTFTSFFIRFKQNVDSHIAAAIRSTLGIPSSVSKSMYIDGRWPETPPAAAASAKTPSPASSELQSSNSNSIWSSLPSEFLAEVEASAESMYQLAWMSFILDSPYSPLMLRQLPQPVPRDLPEGADPSVFGFDDAFEDLLRVTSGQGLEDINVRYAMKKEWLQSFPRGLPPMLWLHQLTRQGLWDGWEPRPDFLNKAIHERWRRWLGDQDDPFHTKKDGAAAGDRGSSPDEQKMRIAAQLESPPARSGEAEIEEELYELIEHGKVLAKSLQASFGHVSKIGDLVLGPNSYVPRSTNDGKLPDGYREDITTEERTEPGGYTTVIKTRVVFDERDRMVSREVETKTTQASKMTSNPTVQSEA
ncbi:hypothetical protein B0T11DRAFT_289321 [Plectosphaerella cucumerina]|uniref:Uncharacterized protein n=1 Tax=Plectosphaerella cucumerina TaxID=40658 RepID=A0A8K0WZ09_9PEZI|nr:hypothetical protein B0T11DRAFT_289321 [Plectosphaerella cucumerina]